MGLSDELLRLVLGYEGISEASHFLQEVSVSPFIFFQLRSSTKEVFWDLNGRRNQPVMFLDVPRSSSSQISEKALFPAHETRHE